MPFLTTAGIAATAAIGGAAISGVSAFGQAKAQKQASAASREAERLRQQQMELDNRRRVTQLIRQAATAQANAESGAVARGINVSDSSAVGGQGSILSQAGANVQAQAENLGIGRNIFAANAQYSEAKATAQTWASVGDFGKTLFASSQQIGQIGDTLFNSKDGNGIGPWDTTWTKG